LHQLDPNQVGMNMDIEYLLHSNGFNGF
jgi:hypothetical protein